MHTSHPTAPHSTENFQFFLEASLISLGIFLKIWSTYVIQFFCEVVAPSSVHGWEVYFSWLDAYSLHFFLCSFQHVGNLVIYTGNGTKFVSTKISFSLFFQHCFETSISVFLRGFLFYCDPLQFFL